jgi:hypothetical protein
MFLGQRDFRFLRLRVWNDGLVITLLMEAVSMSETSAYFNEITGRYIPEHSSSQILNKFWRDKPDTTGSKHDRMARFSKHGWCIISP